MAPTTATKLIHPRCREQKRHMVVYLGFGLCCQFDYRDDPVKPPRSYTTRQMRAA